MCVACLCMCVCVFAWSTCPEWAIILHIFLQQIITPVSKAYPTSVRLLVWWKGTILGKYRIRKNVWTLTQFE